METIFILGFLVMLFVIGVQNREGGSGRNSGSTFFTNSPGNHNWNDDGDCDCDCGCDDSWGGDCDCGGDSGGDCGCD